MKLERLEIAADGFDLVVAEWRDSHMTGLQKKNGQNTDSILHGPNFMNLNAYLIFVISIFCAIVLLIFSKTSATQQVTFLWEIFWYPYRQSGLV